MRSGVRKLAERVQIKWYASERAASSATLSELGNQRECLSQTVQEVRRLVLWITWDNFVSVLRKRAEKVIWTRPERADRHFKSKTQRLENESRPQDTQLWNKPINSSNKSVLLSLRGPNIHCWPQNSYKAQAQRALRAGRRDSFNQHRPWHSLPEHVRHNVACVLDLRKSVHPFDFIQQPVHRSYSLSTFREKQGCTIWTKC